MAKNITVIGENGDILYSTYPKRAAGLIKKGRARRISDTAVRLCAPPAASAENAGGIINKEDDAMNIYELFDNQLSKMQEQLRDDQSENAAKVRTEILKTLDSLKKREQADRVIDVVKEQLDALNASLKNDDAPENAAAREVTRQKILNVLEMLPHMEAKS
ncbi:MAG TPA: hypothetical protein IAA60_09825 [Candidatus Ornithomonoglobus intestinigallinarum]|uniref:Uncharacterized protein n=1 Tax=Candidatus Ornithomonoglobus intestinigallinarum TaxID=2840894 RepID=A0A9D1H3Y5_9FIRM|nr:hypothetical protein [Candidatus Ornithomonoglobus intestinigallinarum]